MQEILNKLESGNFDRPNQRANLFLQVRQYINKLEQENTEYKWQEHLLNEILTGTNYDAKEIINLLLKYKDAIDILIREKIKPSAFLGILKDYKYHNKVDLPYEKVSIYLDCELTQQEYELIKEMLGYD